LFRYLRGYRLADTVWRGFGLPQTQEKPESKVPLYLGTAWYPEQWPESRWDADLTLMEKAHIHFVRITEFAWSTMEPSEGHYDLDWVERAVRMADKHHIAVVLGTPSAAPPAWLTSIYPACGLREAGSVWCGCVER
jgi:beta-galactosidase